MKLLLIDTCGATGSLALADTDRSPAVLAAASLPGRTVSERLVPAVKALASNHDTGMGIGLQSLDAVVVVHGPGSFTGVRVGLSAAKGLCEALGVPVVAISRLAVLAQLAAPAIANVRVHALLDAGRGEFYYGDYLDTVCVREALLTRDELLAAVGRAGPGAGVDERGVRGAPVRKGEPVQIVVVCEPAVAQSVVTLAPRLVAEPAAGDALPLALFRMRRGYFDNTALLDANYLRRTDTEIFSKPGSTGTVVPPERRSQPETPAR